MPQPKFTNRPFGQQNDALAVGENHMIDLRLDVVPGVLLERRHFDFIVEMPDVAHDGLILHALHVIVGDDMKVAGGRDEDIGLVRGVVHGHHAIAFHRGLQRADRIDLGHPHLRGQRAQRLRRALAHIAVAADHGHLARDHHVGGALDGVHQGFAAAVQIVELGLGDRIVDVERREGELPFLGHLIETLDPGGGLLGDALDLGEPRRIPLRIGFAASP